MKSYIIRPLCLCIALLGACSCDEWEYKVQYHDISIGGIESIWDVSSDTFYGMSLSQDWAVYHGDNARQVVYFGKNGKGIVYRIRVDETIDSTLFDYNSEDGCHVNIVCNGSQQKWTFARETPNNNQSDHCIMYTDSTKSLGLQSVIEPANLELYGEIYFKRMHQMVDYKDNADLHMNENVEDEVKEGEGRAAGLETMVKYENRWVTAQASYTLSKAERRADEINNGNWYYATYDQKHNLALNATFHAWRNDFSVAFK
ncbi:MAG: hypothetical protein ACI35N_04885, partial [Marinilabiliaceae bacterium]